MLFKQTSSVRRAHALRGIVLTLVSGIALAQSAWCTSFGWDPNSESDIAGYRLYYGSSSGNYTQSLDVGNVTQASLSNLTQGSTYYAAVAAYNTAAQEGAKSTEVSFVTAVTTPPVTSAPTVSLTSPTSGAGFVAPATISLAATASETGGSIGYVEFYNGSTRVVTVTSSPYTFALGSVAAGTYTFTARAYDTLGVSATSSPVTVTVTAATATNKAPSVSLTSPTSGASFTAPANVTLTAAASDSDGTVSKVEFYTGTSLVATVTSSPYTVAFTGVPVGSYTITACAYDNAGASTTSAPVTVSVVTATVVNKAPTVSLTSPTNGASLTAPASIVLAATASDSDGTISKVEFYNGTTKLGTSTASPYTYTWSGVAAGTYSVKAIAYDNLGAATTSTPATVTVVAAATNKAPTVKLTSPFNGSWFRTYSKITVAATAIDSDGTISKVEFYNGSTLVATDTTSPYSVTFTGVPVGAYTLKARAYDNKGASTISSPVTVYVTRY